MKSSSLINLTYTRSPHYSSKTLNLEKLASYLELLMSSLILLMYYLCTLLYYLCITYVLYVPMYSITIVGYVYVVSFCIILRCVRRPLEVLVQILFNLAICLYLYSLNRIIIFIYSLATLSRFQALLGTRRFFHVILFFQTRISKQNF